MVHTSTGGGETIDNILLQSLWQAKTLAVVNLNPLQVEALFAGVSKVFSSRI